jgi:predicted benzoate:H+ symporter BenE
MMTFWYSAALMIWSLSTNVKVLCSLSMVPLALETEAATSDARTSSIVSPMAASRAGSTCTWIERLRSPPMNTWATPGICEICCARMLSAYSSTSISGSSSDCTARIRIGASDGFTL